VRILVVDDSTAVRTRVAALLASGIPHAQVFQARDGDEALELARAQRADVVVLDLHLPRKGGLKVLAALKAAPVAPRVLVLTADPTEPHRRACLALGADAFLDKATDSARMVEIVLSDNGAAIL
jgi:CheY-like chemotaxis protein